MVFQEQVKESRTANKQVERQGQHERRKDPMPEKRMVMQDTEKNEGLSGISENDRLQDILAASIDVFEGHLIINPSLY